MGKMKFFASALLIGAMAISGCRSTQEALGVGEAAQTNPGPCPRAFSLYDAARIVEIKGSESFSNVGFTGEIGKIRSLCR